MAVHVLFHDDTGGRFNEYMVSVPCFFSKSKEKCKTGGASPSPTVLSLVPLWGTGLPVPPGWSVVSLYGRGKPLPYRLVGADHSTGAPQYSQQPFSSGVVVAPQ